MGWDGGAGWWVHYNVSSDPFLTMNFEFDQDHRPRPGHEVDNWRFKECQILKKMNIFKALGC